MARRATHGDESGPGVVGQTFSLQTDFSLSLRRAGGAEAPRRLKACPTTPRSIGSISGARSADSDPAPPAIPLLPHGR